MLRWASASNTLSRKVRRMRSVALGLAAGLIGAGQGHGAVGRGRLGAAEPGDDAGGVQAGGRQRLLGGGVAARAARPAGQVAAGGVQLEEAHGLGVAVDQRPLGDLLGDRVLQAVHRHARARDVAALGGRQGGLQVGGVGVGQSGGDGGRRRGDQAGRIWPAA
jgi:hypothetical protein